MKLGLHLQTMYFSRTDLEQHEVLTLAPFGFKSSASQGRAYAEEEPAYRTRFQRDRERILHTTAFRRLEYKTQVFVNSEGDYYRTRLTHTLEVAQFGRSIARALGVNQDLVEAICLSHDLGHPPFGHSGEYVLDALMQGHGGFEHNKQSLRIVTKLEKRYPFYDGLNLSWEVLEGIVKHENAAKKKNAAKFNPELRATIEAQIADLADELAYTTSDLDDGLRSGVLQAEQIDGVILWDRVLNELGLSSQRLTELDRHRVIRKLVGIVVSDVINTTASRIAESGATSALELQELPYNVIGLSEEIRTAHRELKRFLYQNMYRHWRVVRMQKKAEKFLSELFHAFVSEPSQLPPSAQAHIAKRGLERTVCDYLAGMTDRYALQEHAKMFDPNTRA